MVVDTNRPSYTECPELLNRTDTICVFDHHRQNSEVIENPVLSYIEPYASSACEMIAEVLQYFSENIKLEPSEADCIYAGILIDTNNFMTKTGVRTFEAAAYLRRASRSPRVSEKCCEMIWLLIRRGPRRSVMQKSTGEHLQSLCARRIISRALQL